jgi:hypothetical protein
VNINTILLAVIAINLGIIVAVLFIGDFEEEPTPKKTKKKASKGKK